MNEYLESYRTQAQDLGSGNTSRGVREDENHLSETAILLQSRVDQTEKSSSIFLLLAPLPL